MECLSQKRKCHLPVLLSSTMLGSSLQIPEAIPESTTTPLRVVTGVNIFQRVCLSQVLKLAAAAAASSEAVAALE